jgi:hypothetical protein
MEFALIGVAFRRGDTLGRSSMEGQAMRTFGALSLVALVAVVGCNMGSSGGPGASDSSKEHYVGKPDESFTLGMVQTTIRQGETKSVSIPIKRTLNFDEDVRLSFGEMPKGISVDDSHPRIKHGETEARFSLTAEDEAALGDFSLKVTGEPTHGGEAVNDFKITVLPHTPRE